MTLARRRDLAAISAHTIGARKAYQMAGQLLFGDVPALSFF
jgi:hypothetical protein